MFRKVYKHLPVHNIRCYGAKGNEPLNFFDKDVAYESEYYYRQVELNLNHQKLLLQLSNELTINWQLAIGNWLSNLTNKFEQQDRKLLKMLKEKTEAEVKAMQKEVRSMQAKIEEYNRDIGETLRFLKSLESDTTENDTKK